jgi:hypothetical protein
MVYRRAVEREAAVQVTIQARVGNDTYDLGSADLDTPDFAQLAELLRRLADELEARA